MSAISWITTVPIGNPIGRPELAGDWWLRIRCSSHASAEATEGREKSTLLPANKADSCSAGIENRHTLPGAGIARRVLGSGCASLVAVVKSANLLGDDQGGSPIAPNSAHPRHRSRSADAPRSGTEPVKPSVTLGKTTTAIRGRRTRSQAEIEILRPVEPLNLLQIIRVQHWGLHEDVVILGGAAVFSEGRELAGFERIVGCDRHGGSPLRHCGV